MTDADNEARARKLDQRHTDLCALADDAGTTGPEADTARTLARGIAKKMRALGWEPGALPEILDDKIPGFEDVDNTEAVHDVPTIMVHGHRAKPYPIAAPYMCPRCGHGRLTSYCALCDAPAVETPRGVFGNRPPQGWS